MADFSAVLKKTIEGLGETTPELRQKVYDKARHAIRGKLAAANPPVAPDVAARQLKALEDAIETVEFDYRIADAVTIAKPARTSPFASSRLAAPAPAAPAPAAPVPAPPAGIAPAAAAVPARPLPSAMPKAPPPEPRAMPAMPPALPPSLPPRRVEPREFEARSPQADRRLPGDAPSLAGAGGSDGVDAAPAESFESLTPFDGPARPVLVRKRAVPLALAAGAFLLVVGGGSAAWLYRDALAGLFGPKAPEVASATAEEPAVVAEAGPVKFTQRLNADGSEVDEGPAGGAPVVGEGTSVAAATTGPGETVPASAADTAGTAIAGATTASDAPAGADQAAAGAQPAGADQPTASDQPVAGGQTAPGAAQPAAATTAPAAEAGVAISQKAIFYEERTSAAQGSANPGSVVWSVVMESPGSDLPPEPAIRAEATVPDRNLSVRMTIRRNGDTTLPASHIIELLVSGPENPASGTIENVLRITFKDTEGAAGNPLFGVPAKIADGFFLVALTDNKAEIDTNLALMKREQWIDIPFVYGSGRRALITLEKGVPGDKVFEEAFKAWGGKADG